jgi:hypothetical protein
VSEVSPDRPIFWIVAGPNGSGKSSSYQGTDIDAFARSIWIINPDLLTARLQQAEGLDLGAANLEAVKRIEVWLEASIRAHQSVGVETVLSTEAITSSFVIGRSGSSALSVLPAIVVLLMPPNTSVPRPNSCLPCTPADCYSPKLPRR